MKIRSKLTLQFASIVALIMIVFSLVVYSFTSLYRQDDFYKRILRRAEVTARYVLESENVSPEQQRQFMIDFYHELPQEAVRVFDTDGKLVFSHGEGDLGITPAILGHLRQSQVLEYDNDVRQVVGVMYEYDGREYLVFASSIDSYSLRKLQNLKIILVVGFMGSLVVVVLAGWLFAKQALRPITKVVDEVEKISANDLHLRLSNAEGKDELSHLAQTFNNMLDRLEQSFEMQSTFVSNASHELRTPLTTMIGELEVALMKPREKEEYQRVLRSTLEDARLLTELSNGLLQIAQASIDQSKIKLSMLRFDELVWMARDQALKRQPDARIEIDFASFPDDEKRLMVQGNEALLLIAVLNVLENAIKFSPDGQVARGQIEVQSRQVVLRVQDRGLGIAAEDLKHVFVPFFRADNVRNITGHGIGLPLAERILRLHRGSIEVHSQINKGTEVMITLPQAFHTISA